jgi:hypothetical protein
MRRLPKAAPRITTRFTAETMAQVVSWGRERGIRYPSQALRALAMEAINRDRPIEARAWQAAYEQALAELRQMSRQALIDAAERLGGRGT